jgi:large subunit ribosomal protein L10
MPRPEKVQAVAEIKERIERARAVFLAEYAGLSVKDQQTLRRNLREGGAEFKVVKMTLARRAAEELELEGIDDLLLGPTGLTFADDDPVTAAKALKDFAKDHDVFAIKGGLLGNDLLTPERVSELAEIEPREVLLAKIAGAAKAPMANLAGLMAAMPRNLASMLQQLVEKKEPGDVPVPSDDAPAAAAEPSGEDAADDAAPVAEDAAATAAETDEDTTGDGDDAAAPDAAEAPAADTGSEPEEAAADADVSASDAAEASGEDEAAEDDTADADASGEEE